MRQVQGIHIATEQLCNCGKELDEHKQERKIVGKYTIFKSIVIVIALMFYTT